MTTAGPEVANHFDAPHLVRLPRIWQLRHNFSAYDAAYIALAEKLRAALAKPGRSTRFHSGHAAAIELF